MIIKGNLMLGFSSIKSLGNIREIKGDLLLQGSSITSLPKGLKVGGDLLLGGSKITKEYILKNNKELINKCYWR